jgi:hypothetical protein
MKAMFSEIVRLSSWMVQCWLITPNYGPQQVTFDVLQTIVCAAIAQLGKEASQTPAVTEFLNTLIVPDVLKILQIPVKEAQ